MKNLRTATIFFVLLLAILALWIIKSDITNKVRCDKKASLQCYQNAFLDIARKKGIPTALEALAKDQDKDPSLKKDCHYIAHALGWEAYSEAKNVPAALYQGKFHLELCETGYVHGVVMRALQETKESLNTADFCDVFPADENLLLRWHCLHSTGHGLLAALNYDLSRTLAECDRMKNYFDREACYGGVFMELVVLQHLPQDKRLSYLRLAEPFWPCSGLDTSRTKPCYYYATGKKLYQISNGDLSKAFELCRPLAKEDREYCWRGIGRVISAMKDFDPKPTLDLCLSGPSESHPACLHPLVFSFTDMHARLEDGRKLCLISPEKLKPVCFKTLGALIPYLHTKEQDQWPSICQGLANNFATDCLQGAEERYLRNKKWQGMQ